jgi:cytochrome c oxidase assembly factor CtaG/putative copper export protein
MKQTTSTPNAQALRSFPVASIATAMVAVAVVAAAVGLVLAGGVYEALPGLADPGPLVTWGTPVTRVLTDIAAIATVGLLLSATALAPSGKDGVLSQVGRRDAVRAARVAIIWAVLAAAQLFFQLALILGVPLSDALDPAVVSTYANELDITRALLFMALLAVVVTVGAITSATTGATGSWLVVAVVAAALPGLAGHSSALGDHELATTAGVTHMVSAVLWVGGLLALTMHALRRDVSLKRPLQRFSVIALTAIILLAVSGLANAYTRVDGLEQLLTTGYGQVTMMKVGLIIGLAVIGFLLRQRVIPSLDSLSRAQAFVRLAAIELTIMAVAIGLGVSLASSPYPREEQLLPSYGESLLGFPYPPAPTVETVVFGFRPDPLFFTASLIAAALYIIGYIRIRQAGITWPVMRLVSWLGGVSVIIWTTSSGISIYSQVSVGLHMTQHMIMTMLAPILLVMGAPATLALRAIKPARGNERGPREWLVWFLHSPITRVLTNPFYVFFVYVIGLYGLYMTPMFGWLMGSHIGHVIMQAHFILSGYLFYWVLIGIDPRPRPLPYWGRLLMLLLALAVHGFFAVAMMMGSTPMAVEWYGVVRPDWVTDPLADTLLGGQVTWGLGEIPALIVLIAIAVQWSRSDEREAKRKDRQADRDGNAELEDYNAYLQSLSGPKRR